MEFTKEEMIAAFELWDREYREKPEEFMNTVDHLLRSTPEEYGPAATTCFIAYVEKIREQKEEE